jgi:hypothetical protein
VSSRTHHIARSGPQGRQTHTARHTIGTDRERRVYIFFSVGFFFFFFSNHVSPLVRVLKKLSSEYHFFLLSSPVPPPIVRPAFVPSVRFVTEGKIQKQPTAAAGAR